MERRYHLSKTYFSYAENFIPGGVNSPVRACKQVEFHPIFIERASGCYLFDVDGNKYIDYLSSWGPMILGHCHPYVEHAIKSALVCGTSYGIPTWNEVRLAKMLVDAVPSVEMVRLVNSGTEATMSAIRLARAYTNRKKIVKFDGCYHGHGDSFLVKAGSGLATFGIPATPGVPEEITQNTISIPFNNEEILKETLEKHGDEIACIIVEPVPANMGVIPPKGDFLHKLREWTKEKGILLIFDEVITGFRLSYGGAQEYFGIMPDLTCLGKIIGGGLPVGAYGGRKEIMQNIAPCGQVYQAGTLSGNPLATASGIATLEMLNRPGIYESLEEKSAYFEAELKAILKKHDIKCRVQRVSSMLTAFFGHDPDTEILDFNQALKSDTKAYARFFRETLHRGVYIAPSQFEALFLSMAHTYQDIDFTLNVIDDIFKNW